MIVCFCVVLIGKNRDPWQKKKNQKSVKPTCSSGDYFALWSRTPLIPTSSPGLFPQKKLFSKIQANAGSRLGTKNALHYCAQQFLLSSFREFVHDHYCLDHGLSGSCTKEMHVVRKLSVWYKIPIWFQNTVCPPARKLKTLFQKYKLELTTGTQGVTDASRCKRE